MTEKERFGVMQLRNEVATKALPFLVEGHFKNGGTLENVTKTVVPVAFELGDAIAMKMFNDVNALGKPAGLVTPS